jgi:pimeloyl-ACP methyl ester carboxylesterase
MRASAYLGDLGGLDHRRQLVLLDLRGSGHSAVPADPGTYRCDRLVDDVEALREHLGLERMDILAHSAGGSLALLYAARFPERVARLALITVTPWALGMPATAEDRLEAARLREGEPWFEEAFPAFEAWLKGDGEFDPVFIGISLRGNPVLQGGGKRILGAEPRSGGDRSATPAMSVAHTVADTM